MGAIGEAGEAVTVARATQSSQESGRFAAPTGTVIAFASRHWHELGSSSKAQKLGFSVMHPPVSAKRLEQELVKQGCPEHEVVSLQGPV